MDIRPSLDKLTTILTDEKEKTESTSIEEPSEEEVQGLRYRRGERLIDSVTGKEVIVRAGKRAIGTIQAPKPGGSEGVFGGTP